MWIVFSILFAIWLFPEGKNESTSEGIGKLIAALLMGLIAGSIWA